MAATELLIENLRQTRIQYAELVEIGGSKKECIVQNRLNELSQLVTKETKCLKRLAELEQERLQAVAACQSELGLAANPAMPLDNLTRAVVKSEDKKRLREMLDSVAAEASALKALNETNQALVKQALDFVNLSLDLLTAGPEDDMVYQAPARHHASASVQRKRMFDTKA